MARILVMDDEQRNTRFLRRTLPLLILVVLSAQPVQAQDTADQTAADVLLCTDEVLQEVAPLVQESDSEQARRIYDTAVTKQHQAHELLERERPLFAVRVSLRARDAAKEAQRLARESLLDEGHLRRRLDRLFELQTRLHERARETGNAEALRFVEEAEALFKRAREQYRRTNYRQALALIQASETQLNRAARILFETGDAERLEHELERTAELIAQAVGRIADADDPALADLFARAEETLGRARGALADRQPLMAMRFAQQAREQAQRVLRQLGPAPDPEGVADQIQHFDAQAERLMEAVAAADDAQASRLLEQALDLRDQAGQALDQGRSEAALRQIRTALDLQRQVAERVR